MSISVPLPAWLGAATHAGSVLRLRNPPLLPFQLAGMVVAVVGMRRLAGPVHAYLWHSLLFFGLMNASSVLAHVLAPRDTPMWRAALDADIAFTGASSLSLLLHQIVRSPRSSRGAGATAAACWALLVVLLGVVVFGWPNTPWLPEAVYLGTTALAAHATGHRLLWRWLALPRRVRQQLAPRLALPALGVTTMLLCLPLDPLLCAAAGPWLGTVPLLFGGSALGFAAIVLLSDDNTEDAGVQKGQAGHSVGAIRAGLKAE